MTDESELKTELVRQCKRINWYARRIEAHDAVGILDLIIVPTAGFVMFIEGKIVDGLKFYPTDRQYIEGCRILNAKGNGIPVLVGWRNKVMYVANGWSREEYITKSFKQEFGWDYARTLKEWQEWKIKQSLSAS